jgi:large subunit ribosomal protein L6
LAGVKVQAIGQNVTISGPRGELRASVHPALGVSIKDNVITVARSTELKEHRALHGLWRALLANMVRGVTEGYSKKLELVGVGYRAELKGKKLQLMLGYSHPILFAPPDGVKIEAPTQTNVTVSGIDRELVGQVAAKIRSFRPPEPYKGKGVKYDTEKIRRKAGKAAAASGAKA